MNKKLLPRTFAIQSLFLTANRDFSSGYGYDILSFLPIVIGDFYTLIDEEFIGLGIPTNFQLKKVT